MYKIKKTYKVGRKGEAMGNKNDANEVRRTECDSRSASWRVMWEEFEEIKDSNPPRWSFEKKICCLGKAWNEAVWMKYLDAPDTCPRLWVEREPLKLDEINRSENELGNVNTGVQLG